MSFEELRTIIKNESKFITDFEEIVDTIIDAEHVYLYDTSAISSHEKGFNKYKSYFFSEHIKDTPVVITDTIANELRIVEDNEKRYLNFFSNFKKVIFIKEEELLELLKVEYDADSARKHFVTGTEKAFTTILPLKERVRESRRHFASLELFINDAYTNFFLEKQNENKGEMSLIWTASIIKQLHGDIDVTFIGVDHDLYDYVERSFFEFGNDLGNNKQKAISKNVYIASNDSLIQSHYYLEKDKGKLDDLVVWYRNPDRRLIYHEKNNGLLNWTRNKEKLTNLEFIQYLLEDSILIIY